MRFKKREKTNVWLNISDLMAGILGIFIVYFVIQSISIQINIQNLAKEKEKLKAEKTGLILEKEKLKVEKTGLILEKESLGAEKSRIDTERKIYKDAIDRMYSIKIDIITAIKNQLDVDVDEKTGAIRLDSSILFDSGEYKLKDKGKEYLKRFMPKYLEILLLDKKIKENLSDIIIEGHTDRQGTYNFNLDLSQKRANTVAQFIFSDEFGNYLWKEELKKYITANGRSYSFYLGEDISDVHKESRRVEIKFQLNDEKVIQELKKIIEKSN